MNTAELLALIEQYGQQCEAAAALANTRYAHHAGDRRREAEATLALIRAELTERDARFCA